MAAMTMQGVCQGQEARSKQKVQKWVLAMLLVSLVALLCLSAMAYAGAGSGTEFAAIQQTLMGWMKGILGKVIALSSLAVGLGLAVVRQSVVSVMVGIGIALAANYGPDVLDAIVGAAILPAQLAGTLL
ncbi:TraA family conjugative transfer protein [Chromobacterium sp. IIBBL 290-4]|uniref:TraA family conjugative transfer protein n=1 Tax=Chromobacterium sp. IIBBL 290-4 TaxID=2953890 RepID=UPI0020B66595|nr:TraA family conjugative transfer protein [Chromobacterium sp. IIBBL 290-4]UTH74238.1 hypothetical protein NKT35_22310 [Chromobacterium sp. IIBBL 290-4]